LIVAPLLATARLIRISCSQAVGALALVL